jgi:DNA processing protein
LTNSELKERLTDSIALLSIPGVGRQRFDRLVGKFGSPAAVLAAPLSELEQVPGLPRKVASAVRQTYDGTQARRLAARVIQLGWSVLFAGDPEYPSLLAHIPDPPPLLFFLGDNVRRDDRMIAIVGTRHATERGKRLAGRLARDMVAEGLVVVSGMAEGIDSAAHRGALEGKGRTVAVWGTSLDIVYPGSNRDLAENIKRHGAVYSEYLPGTEPAAAFFPERNRIISGLSDGTVVVEAGEKSGALITARFCLEHGRELFAVPGSPDARRSAGANRLIKDGARLLTDVNDIFDELPRLRGQVAARRFKAVPDMTAMERQMVSQLSEGPLQIDQLSRAAEVPVADLMKVLLALELKGVVQELSGKRFILAE